MSYKVASRKMFIIKSSIQMHLNWIELNQYLEQPRLLVASLSAKASWNYVAAEHSVCPCWSLSTAESAPKWCNIKTLTQTLRDQNCLCSLGGKYAIRVRLTNHRRLWAQGQTVDAISSACVMLPFDVLWASQKRCGNWLHVF